MCVCERPRWGQQGGRAGGLPLPGTMKQPSKEGLCVCSPVHLRVWSLCVSYEGVTCTSVLVSVYLCVRTSVC